MKEIFKLVKYMHGSAKYFILAIIFVALETSLELAIPIFMADIIDYGIVARDMNFIYRQGIIMVLLAICSLILGLLYSHFSSIAINNFGSELRKIEFEKIQEYSFKNLDNFETSSIITRLTGDVSVIQNAASNLRQIVRGPVMLVMGLVYSFSISLEISLIFIISAPILAIGLFYIVYKVSPYYAKLQGKVDKLNVVVEENLNAIRIVKAYTMEDYEINKFDEVDNDLKRHATKTFTLTALNAPLFQLVMYASIVMIMLYGGKLIFDGQLLVGELTGILSYVLQIMNSFMMLSNVFLMLTRSLASAERINEIIEEEIDLKDGSLDIDVSTGDIKFENVYFKYDTSAKEDVLKDINMHIKAGDTIAIIGGTGSGKSSIVSLLPRLYDVSRGRILIDDIDIKEYNLTKLRDSIAIVLQKNILFEGSIKDNLLWGNSLASDEEIDEALRHAGAYDFVYSFNDGIDTYLNESGINLSGGQKQRLCIARALIKKPKILILDDSTSAVDSNTERLIRDGLGTYKDMTKIIIAQRISSIMHADEIYIIDDGRIVDHGSHQYLLENNDIYKDLYDSQMRGDK